jgi:acyl transferase domain-containing protein
MNITTRDAGFGIKHVVISSKQPLEASAEFKVGVGSMPYLADHAFQNMVVLPGSFYIEMALRMERDHFQRIPRLVRNISFDTPIILSADDAVIKAEVKDLGEGCVEYTFREAGMQYADRPHARRHAARLEIDLNSSASADAHMEPFPIAAFQAQSRTVFESGPFYEKLRHNLNQYGPSFQNVTSIWRAGDQTLARLSVAPLDLAGESHCVHPTLLDAMTQTLAPFVMEQGIHTALDRAD